MEIRMWHELGGWLAILIIGCGGNAVVPDGATQPDVRIDASVDAFWPDASVDAFWPDAPIDAFIPDAQIDAPLNGLEIYLKASNPGSNDTFGYVLALSADGSTLAVGAEYEDSNATGIGNNQADNSASDSGAVYVFVRSGATWTQQAYIKASNSEAGDAFGSSVALSADGSTLAVGAIGEDSAAVGIDGNQADNTVFRAGAAYVFTRSGATWTQRAYVKASNTNRTDLYIGNERFGSAVALSNDGATLAVAADYEDGASTGVNGDPYNQGIRFAGAVYVFTYAGATWSQQAYVKATVPGMDNAFGRSIALSGDGATLAVGAQFASTAYVFTRTGTTWTTQAQITGSNTAPEDYFHKVALSADGSTLAVGAYGEASAATGINGDQSDNSVSQAGAVYVFTRAASLWTQRAYIKASTTGAEDQFGLSVALSSDGATLAVGAPQGGLGSTGPGGVYLFSHSATVWTQTTQIAASYPDAADTFGCVVALAANASLLAVGARGEDSAAIGVEGDATNNSVVDSGAAYLIDIP